MRLTTALLCLLLAACQRTEDGPAPPPAPRHDSAAAVAAFIAAMRDVNVWGKFITKAQAYERDTDTLIITMAPKTEVQTHRLRLQFAKSLALAWQNVNKHPGANSTIRLEDVRGQRVGGSTMFGDVEVDPD